MSVYSSTCRQADKTTDLIVERHHLGSGLAARLVLRRREAGYRGMIDDSSMPEHTLAGRNIELRQQLTGLRCARTTSGNRIEHTTKIDIRARRSDQVDRGRHGLKVVHRGPARDKNQVGGLHRGERALISTRGGIDDRQVNPLRSRRLKDSMKARRLDGQHGRRIRSTSIAPARRRRLRIQIDDDGRMTGSGRSTSKTDA